MDFAPPRLYAARHKVRLGSTRRMRSAFPCAAPPRPFHPAPLGIMSTEHFIAGKDAPLATDAGPLQEYLRVGELKTQRAPAAGDAAAIREGDGGGRRFARLDAARRRVYRCSESRLELGATDDYRGAPESRYGADPLRRAEVQPDRCERFSGIAAPGPQLAGGAMHRNPPAAHDKPHPQTA